ncbi:hypothetical protein D3C73_1219710 [compost metagenome]
MTFVQVRSDHERNPGSRSGCYRLPRFHRQGRRVKNRLEVHAERAAGQLIGHPAGGGQNLLRRCRVQQRQITAGRKPQLREKRSGNRCALLRLHRLRRAALHDRAGE